MREHEQGSRPLGAFELSVPAVFALVLIALSVAGKVPSVVLGFYAAVNVIAFFVYWHDKNAARRGAWRTSEAALLGIAFAGGWPAAFIARHLFRHKTRKQPFRTFFWLSVLANCGLLSMVVAMWGSGVRL